MKYLLFLAIPFFVIACKTYSEEDKQSFSEQVSVYAKKHGYKIEQSESGLGIEILEEGKGTEKIQRGSQVELSYTGTLTNGHVFDRTPKGEPFAASLTGLIGGFQEGLLGLTEGTRVRLVIPPNMGYGSEATGEIPPNSILIFDITVENVY